MVDRPQNLPPGGLAVIAIPVLLLLALAAYRATQLIVHDTILDTPRTALATWHANRPDSTLRGALVTLISCIYCAGWWISGALLTAWLLTTGQWHDAPLIVHGIEWLAVAGAAALAGRWDDTREVSR